MKGATFPVPLPASPWGMIVMFAVAGILIHLAIRKQYEPTLLLPIGFGALLGNLPNSPLNQPGGLLFILNEIGIRTEVFPLFIFIGIGALMDFRPLLSQPIFALMGAAGQFGIFATLILRPRSASRSTRRPQSRSSARLTVRRASMCRRCSRRSCSRRLP